MYIILKGTVRTIPGDLLNKEELVHPYDCYPVSDLRSQRNKVILSLMVYQGGAVGDLHQLKAEDVNLKEGKVYLPVSGLMNSRVLKPEASQIMELYGYIQVTRPQILSERTIGKSGRKPKQMISSDQITRLFISMNGCGNLKNSLLHFGYALRKLYPKYRNTGQVRQSVIIEWLKEKDLRTVQYMAGHRYVSSTERYQTSNLEDLKEAMHKFHPLRT